MNGLLSSASPWQNDSVSSNTTSKKRIPSLSIPRNKTIKNNGKSQSNLDDIQNLENDETIFNIKENFTSISNDNLSISPSSPINQHQSQNTIDSIQQDNQTRMTRVQQLINSMNMENDGQSLANFKPIEYSNANAANMANTNNGMNPNANNGNNNIPIKPLYSMNEQPSILSNPYSSYRDVYLGDSKIGNVPYYKNNVNVAKGDTMVSDRLMEKLNRMLYILEEQQYEPTKHITEEFILYTFLGIFVIYIVDSFTRSGKYIR